MGKKQQAKIEELTQLNHVWQDKAISLGELYFQCYRNWRQTKRDYDLLAAELARSLFSQPAPPPLSISAELLERAAEYAQHFSCVACGLEFTADCHRQCLADADELYRLAERAGLAPRPRANRPSPPTPTKQSLNEEAERLLRIHCYEEGGCPGIEYRAMCRHCYQYFPARNALEPLRIATRPTEDPVPRMACVATAQFLQQLVENLEPNDNRC